MKLVKKVIACFSAVTLLLDIAQASGQRLPSLAHDYFCAEQQLIFLAEAFNPEAIVQEHREMQPEEVRPASALRRWVGRSRVVKGAGLFAFLASTSFAAEIKNGVIHFNNQHDQFALFVRDTLHIKPTYDSHGSVQYLWNAMWEGTNHAARAADPAKTIYYLEKTPAGPVLKAAAQWMHKVALPHPPALPSLSNFDVSNLPALASPHDFVIAHHFSFQIPSISGILWDSMGSFMHFVLPNPTVNYLVVIISATLLLTYFGLKGMHSQLTKPSVMTTPYLVRRRVAPPTPAPVPVAKPAFFPSHIAALIPRADRTAQSYQWSRSHWRENEEEDVTTSVSQPPVMRLKVRPEPSFFVRMREKLTGATPRQLPLWTEIPEIELQQPTFASPPIAKRPSRMRVPLRVKNVYLGYQMVIPFSSTRNHLEALTPPGDDENALVKMSYKRKRLPSRIAVFLDRWLWPLIFVAIVGVTLAHYGIAEKKPSIYRYIIDFESWIFWTSDRVAASLSAGLAVLIGVSIGLITRLKSVLYGSETFGSFKLIRVFLFVGSLSALWFHTALITMDLRYLINANTSDFAFAGLMISTGLIAFFLLPRFRSIGSIDLFNLKIKIPAILLAGVAFYFGMYQFALMFPVGVTSTVVAVALMTSYIGFQKFRKQAPYPSFMKRRVVRLDRSLFPEKYTVLAPDRGFVLKKKKQANPDEKKKDKKDDDSDKKDQGPSHGNGSGPSGGVAASNGSHVGVGGRMKKTLSSFHLWPVHRPFQRLFTAA